MESNLGRETSLVNVKWLILKRNAGILVTSAATSLATTRFAAH